MIKKAFNILEHFTLRLSLNFAGLRMARTKATFDLTNLLKTNKF